MHCRGHVENVCPPMPALLGMAATEFLRQLMNHRLVHSDNF